MLATAKKYAVPLFSVTMYYSDIITDIVVAKDLNDSGSDYFGVSVGIILFSVLGGTCLQMFSRQQLNKMNQGERYQEEGRFVRYVSLIGQFCYFTSQLPFLINAIYLLSENACSIEATELKLMEALLESGPESLFQLFILLHTLEEHSPQGLLIYYASISISLLNLVYVMVDYEMKNYRWQCENFEAAFKKPISAKYPQTLSPNSLYILVLFAYRFAEIFSRVGLLACLGYVYNGNCVFYVLAADFASINVLNYLKFCLRVQVEERIYTETEIVEDYDSVAQLRDRAEWQVQAHRRQPRKRARLFAHRATRVRSTEMNRTDYERSLRHFERNLKKEDTINVNHQILSKLVPQLLKNIKNVGLFANYFMFDAVKREYIQALQDEYGDDMKSVPEKTRWWNRLHAHFVVKLTTGLTISCVLLQEIDWGKRDELFHFVAIGSVCCYFIQMPLMAAIRIWGRGVNPRAFTPWYASPEPEEATIEYDVRL